MKKKKSGILVTVIVVLIFLAGLSLLLYPTVSNYWNSLHQSQAITSYDEEVNRLQQEEYQRIWEEAEAYNRSLLSRPNSFALTEEQALAYSQVLSPGGTDVMAYLEIPVIGVTLPIRHGTENDVLAKAVGHLEWSSLPVGGESTHCVLSGHRGLPSSELLTNIDHLEKGDVFYLHVLGQVLEYKVDQIAVVEPDDFSLLGITKGEDYVTLVTCTPYGINSHRLLVRGSRVNADGTTSGGSVTLPNEVRSFDPVYIVAGVLLALIVVAFLFLLLGGKKKKEKGGGGDP